jgi:ABC-type polar amino acid transport system ATPase subunit
VLYRGARILILDEPTAVLVPQEVDELFDNLRGLTAEGLTVLFISHKLDEVLAVADEIHRDPPRHHGPYRRSESRDGAATRRADGRQRTPGARTARVDGD